MQVCDYSHIYETLWYNKEFITRRKTVLEACRHIVISIHFYPLIMVIQYFCPYIAESQSLEHDAKVSKVVVKFCNSPNIESAFTKMTSEIESILEPQKFPKLRRACVQRINSLGSNLPRSLVTKLRNTVTLDDMLDVFSESPYWN